MKYEKFTHIIMGAERFHTPVSPIFQIKSKRFAPAANHTEVTNAFNFMVFS